MDVAEEVLAIAKVRARKAGRAVLIAGALRVEPDDDAFILAPLKMAGEEAAWAVAFGRRGKKPTFTAAADPRNRDDENENVLAPLAVALDEYFRECWAEERAPQVWVASSAAVRFLDTIADRRASRDASVALVGRHCWLLVDRSAHAGQQVLIPASDVLTEHFATGQSTIEDAHLGALLAWIEPPSGKTAEQASREAEDQPAGVATDVRLDMKLEDVLTELAGLRRENKNVKRQKDIAKIVSDALRPEALRVYGLIEHAIDALSRQPLTSIRGLATLRANDFSKFDFYMARNFIPRYFSDKEKAQHLAGREDAVGVAEDVIRYGDDVVRAIDELAGEVLVGTIVGTRDGKQKGSISHVDIETDQVVSRLRVGDRVRLDASTNIDLQLLDATAPDARGVRALLFRVGNGKRSVGAFVRKEVQLLPASGGGFDRSQSHIKRAHDSGVWVISKNGTRPPARRKAAPPDPVKALEKLK